MAIRFISLINHFFKHFFQACCTFGVTPVVFASAVDAPSCPPHRKRR
jgi:hypothetical protein